MGLWEPLFFWVFALGAVGSSVAVVALRNPLYSALALILDFFFFAGLYGLLSAHFMAVTQVLVYGGAIMVVFLFIIMLLNLKEEELERFEFRIHHLLALFGAVGMLVFVTRAIVPLVDNAEVEAKRAEAAQVYTTASQAHEARVDEAKALEDRAERTARLAELNAAEPRYQVKTPTAVLGLNADLSEAGLEGEYRDRIVGYQEGRARPNSGKYRRFDDSKPMVVPPALTGEGLVTKRGELRASTPATFGTVQPISILLINRFVVPFQLTALLLLAAIVGAVIIAKRRI